MPTLQRLPSNEQSLVVDRSAVRQVLESPDSFATTLFSLLAELYGDLDEDDDDQPDWLKWDLVTLATECATDFAADVPSENLSKILAAINIFTSNAFYKRPYWFVQMSQALGGHGLNPEVLAIPSLLDCTWAIVEAAIIYTPGDDEVWNEAIPGMLAKMADDEGLENPPDVLAELLEPYRSQMSDLASFDTGSPEIFAAEFAAHTERGRVFDQEINSRLGRLLAQLEHLPVKSPQNREAIVERLAQSLRGGSRKAT